MSFNRAKWPLLAAICIAAGGLFATLGPGLFSTRVHAADDAKPVPIVDTAGAAQLNDLSKAFRSVHDAVKDSVVSIDTSRRMSMVNRQRIPDEFRRMLPPELQGPDDQAPTFQGPNDNGNNNGNNNARPNRGNGNGNNSANANRLVPYGSGSGVIIDAQGHILTNNHVVEDADSITVRLDDGRNVPAKIVGRDPKSDLAVIQISAPHLVYARIGDSDVIDVGDWVLAFGSPFRFEHTMTQGIISAKGRQIDIIASHDPALQGLTYENYLQTDAAINPGNSGGPLVNLKGEVIGINSAIASNSGDYNGIGFAIPSNDARWIADSLIKAGKVTRGYMGVSILDINDPRDPTARENAKALGYDGINGVLVKEIRSDSPAKTGGLELNDIVTSLNGKKIQNITQLRTEIARTAPGTKVTLGVFRDGKDADVTFAVGTQPDTAVQMASRTGSSGDVQAVDLSSLGLAVVQASKGVVITDVDPQGLAGGTGLEKGDIIYSAQGKQVKTVDGLQEIIKNAALEKGINLAVHAVDGSDRSIFLMTH